jgi:hypothetical protein
MATTGKRPVQGDSERRECPVEQKMEKALEQVHTLGREEHSLHQVSELESKWLNSGAS